jgi:hypothetical protein
MNEFFTAELARQRQTDLLREASNHRLAREAKPKVGGPHEPIVHASLVHRIALALTPGRSRIQPVA